MHTTDNRWSPGASGATVPDDTPAAYAARWIDMGDHTLADVLPDRQGFAYDDEACRDRLIDFLFNAGRDLRVPALMGLIRHDITTRIVVPHQWVCYMRRAGGYIYVDAWLTS